jgi:hypothetical protein
MEPGLQKIKDAASGLLYLSESDYPFEEVCLGGSSSSLEERLLALSGKAKSVQVEQITLEHFLRNMVKVYPGATPEQQQTAQRFQYLQQVLQEELTDINVYRIGNIQIDAFIIGKLKDGTYGGLRTKLVET